MEATNKLTAVNSMLATIGEAPLNTLNDIRVVDAVTAVAALDEVTREVLVEGWTFNTDVNFPLHPDAFAPHEIEVPSTAMQCIPSGKHAAYTVRAGKIYNPSNFSYSFKDHGPVLCKVIWHAAFDDLPEVTRQFVALRAGRRFQKRAVGSDLLHVITEEDEREARRLHKRANTRIEKKNFLLGSQSTRSISQAR